jgi:hypothetical protein
MVLDSKLNTIIAHFGINKPEDWQTVHPDSILAVADVGPQTLNHLRLMLANRGITLKGDETPAYWQTHLGALRGASQISGADQAVVTPFTVLIDADEKQPFSFLGIRADANQGNRPLIVRTQRKHLGDTHGDYSVEGLEGWAHVERKSMADWQSTVLGWGGGRERFERTLGYLNEIPCGAVVIECEELAAIEKMPSYGTKTVKENRKIFYRTVLAWKIDYRVPFIYSFDRHWAEKNTYRILERQWKHQHAKRKRAALDASANMANDTIQMF